MTEKHIELARKLKALVDRGESGERENAEGKLSAFMQKHGITEADLEAEAEDWHQLHIESALYRRLAEQIISRILGSGFFMSNPAGTPRHKPFLKCTWAQFIEAQSKIDFYTPLYKRAKKEFEMAFIMANGLFAKRTEQAVKQTPSPEDLEIRARAMVLASGMEKSTFLKQIDSHPASDKPNTNP